MTGAKRLTTALVLWATCLSCGCAITDIGVSNPLPEVRRVAIAPFINLSTEIDVDLGRDALFGGGYSDRRFAQAYYAELQKVPGFEVIPVGVVDQAIAASDLPMNGPEDYLAIARSIGADAIVVGAVTDFDPYHPRLGLQVQWYAHDSTPPPAATMPYEREWDEEHYREPEEPGWFERHRMKRSASRTAGCEVVRAQSPPALLDATATVAAPVVPVLPVPVQPSALPYGATPPPVRATLAFPSPHDMPPVSSTELLPLYSYTRFLDGRDSRLTARLRDYVDLSGDTRSGGWEGYLSRSDDFIRFACYVTINEMLMLHGGESSRRVVFKPRKQLSHKL